MPVDRKTFGRRTVPLAACAALAAIPLAATPATQAAPTYAYTVTDLGTLGGTISYGQGVNAAGQVTGFSFLTGSSNYHAVRWTGTAATDLGTLGGASSQGLAINTAGQVAGFSFLTGNSGYHATVWTGTTATDLGTLGGAYSQGFAINTSGQVAGYSLIVGNSADHAVRWTGTTATDLGTLGGTKSFGYAINTAGQVAGYSYIASGYQHAFLYSNGVMSDLNSLIDPTAGWTLTTAQGLSDTGYITGYGDIGGQQHAFLLTPNAINGAPEPSEWAVLGFTGLGIGGLLWRARKRMTNDN